MMRNHTIWTTKRPGQGGKQPVYSFEVGFIVLSRWTRTLFFSFRKKAFGPASRRDSKTLLNFNDLFVLSRKMMDAETTL